MALIKNGKISEIKRLVCQQLGPEGLMIGKICVSSRLNQLNKLLRVPFLLCPQVLCPPLVFGN